VFLERKQARNKSFDQIVAGDILKATKPYTQNVHAILPKCTPFKRGFMTSKSRGTPDAQWKPREIPLQALAHKAQALQE